MANIDASNGRLLILETRAPGNVPAADARSGSSWLISSQTEGSASLSEVQLFTSEFSGCISVLKLLRKLPSDRFWWRTRSSAITEVNIPASSCFTFFPRLVLQLSPISRPPGIFCSLLLSPAFLKLLLVRNCKRKKNSPLEGVRGLRGGFCGPLSWQLRRGGGVLD